MHFSLSTNSNKEVFSCGTCEKEGNNLKHHIFPNKDAVEDTTVSLQQENALSTPDMHGMHGNLNIEDHYFTDPDHTQ